MADWLVAQVSHQRREHAAHHIRRVGYAPFYPMVRRTFGRSRRVEEAALYSGYMFVRSPRDWYSVLTCCSAVFGIVAQSSTLEPLRSARLDSHVDQLFAQADDEGFIEQKISGTKFMRGDRVCLVRGMAEGFTGKFLRLRSGDGAEVALDRTGLKVVVFEDALEAAG